MKRIILIIIGFLLIPSIVLADAPVLVQSDQEYTGSSSSEAFNSDVTSGNFILVKVFDGKTSTGTPIGDPTVSDTKHPYTKIAGNTWVSGSRNNLWVYCTIATSTTALTVSVTRGLAGTDMGFIIEEWSGVVNTDCNDIATTTQNNAASTNWVANAVDAPADSTVNAHVGESYVVSNPTNQNGYITIQTINSNVQRGIYQRFSSATSTVAWLSGGGNVLHTFAVLVLQGASSGEPTATPTFNLKGAIMRLIGNLRIQ